MQYHQPITKIVIGSPRVLTELDPKVFDLGSNISREKKYSIYDL